MANFCARCGKQNGDGQAFCQGCGQKLIVGTNSSSSNSNNVNYTNNNSNTYNIDNPVSGYANSNMGYSGAGSTTTTVGKIQMDPKKLALIIVGVVLVLVMIIFACNKNRILLHGKWRDNKGNVVTITSDTYTCSVVSGETVSLPIDDLTNHEFNVYYMGIGTHVTYDVGLKQLITTSYSNGKTTTEYFYRD